ncbi:MAG TPA: S24/S26 family peptidase [Terriglobia bacterium]|nr:S24/S26 family peptidase [Terriglobia bacterium]
MGPISEVASNLKAELAVEVLRSFGEAQLPVTGASMLPALWPGDVIRVRRGDVTEVRPGEIVLFLRDGRIVAHRVVQCCSGTGTLPVLHQDGTHDQTHSQSGCATMPTTGGATSFLVTRGDRVKKSDAPVAAEELLGRVVAIERNHGRGRRRILPRPTPWARIASWVLCRSELGTRSVIYLRRRLRIAD